MMLYSPPDLYFCRVSVVLPTFNIICMLLFTTAPATPNLLCQMLQPAHLQICLSPVLQQSADEACDTAGTGSCAKSVSGRWAGMA